MAFCFPVLYDDELLYSIAARFQFMNGITAQRTNRMLFGSATQPNNCNIPAGLQHFATFIPDEMHSSRELLHKHTLFPYHRAMMTDEEAAAVEAAILRGDVESAKTSRREPSMVPVPRQLRFCSQCLKEMTIRSGEAYWRRDHQIAAIVVCPDHGCFLRSSCVARGRELAYYMADPSTCPSDAPSVLDLTNTRSLAEMAELARTLKNMLEENKSIISSLEDWTSSLAELCESKGLHLHSPYYKKKVRAAFEEHFSYLEGIWPTYFDAKPQNDWLKRAVSRSRRKPTHPIFRFLIQKSIESIPDSEVYRSSNDVLRADKPGVCCRDDRKG